MEYLCAPRKLHVVNEVQSCIHGPVLLSRTRSCYIRSAFYLLLANEDALQHVASEFTQICKTAMCSAPRASSAQRMIDRPGSTQKAGSTSMFVLIPLAAPPLFESSVLYVNCPGVCVCGAPSINLVWLGLAAERQLQWATHPVRRYGEIQCP